MIKPNLLAAALMAAVLLTAPAMARNAQYSHHGITNARATMSAQKADCCRNRASDLRGPTEHDVWGHWGAYYGPMVHAP